MIRFNVLTTGRRLFAEAPEDGVADDTHPLFPLFAAGQAVIGQIRRFDEGSS
jgi:hypothetical protein